MGRILQVRVMAWTFDEAEVERAWPKLYGLAWPVGGGGTHGPAGVVELAAALEDQYKFGDWSAETKADLEPGVTRLAQLRAQLEKVLGDWQPQAANDVTYAIEEALDQLEALAPRP